MAKRNTAEVLTELRKVFPSGKVTRQELKAHCKANKVPYPRFITKDHARRAGRGKYSLALRPAAKRPAAAARKAAPAAAAAAVEASASA